jgi:uncharacterized membrane protein YhdT
MSSNRTLPDEGWTEDPRYRVSNREALIAAAFFVAYIVVTIGTAWLLGGNKGVDEIGFVFGFPDWLFWSTFVLGAVFCAVPYFLIKRFFSDMPLDADSEWSDQTGDASSAARPRPERS